MYRRGRYWHADLRPWGGDRSVLRNPKAKGWPRRGDKTEDEDIARRWAWKYVDLHRSGTRRDQLGLPGQGTPISDAAKKWLDASERKVADSTYQQRRTVSASLAKRLPGTVVEDVEAEALQEWLDDLLAAGYAVSTLHTYRAHLQAFFRDMADDNPADAVKLPPIPPNDARAWEDHELDMLREAAGEGYTRRLVEFALATGGRHLELFAATWEAINAKERTIRYTRQLRRGGRGYKHLKGKSNRTTLILPGWWDWHDPKGRGLVLPREDGSVHTSRSSYDIIRDLLERAELHEEGVGAHRFRHTYARLFLEKSDGAMELLSRSLGHASISTTENQYGHFRTETAARLARSRIYGDGTLRVVE